MIAEFGIDWRTDDGKYDPDGQGQNLHNGLWAGVMAGGAGGPMLWWWDSYVDRRTYGVLPRGPFVGQIDWAHTPFRPAGEAAVTTAGAAPQRFGNLEFTAESGWGKTGGNRYRFRRDGRIEGGPLAGAVGNPHKKELFHALEFELDMPAEGRFAIDLAKVSARARLQIRVDDRLQVDAPLTAGPPGQGPWKSSVHFPQWNLWQSQYDRPYEVTVPAGKHVVSVSNAEGDWLSISGGRVTNYRSSRYPPVRVLALTSDTTTLAWLQDKNSTWKSVLDKVPAATQTDLRLAIPEIPAGAYRVQWWNTYSGEASPAALCTADAHGLALAVPTFSRDTAAVIRRTESP